MAANRYETAPAHPQATQAHVAAEEGRDPLGPRTRPRAAGVRQHPSLVAPMEPPAGAGGGDRSANRGRDAANGGMQMITPLFNDPRILDQKADDGDPGIPET